MSYVVELIPGRMWLRNRLTEQSAACHSVDEREHAVTFATHAEASAQAAMVRRQWPGYAEVVSVRSPDSIHEPAHYQARERYVITWDNTEWYNPGTGDRTRDISEAQRMTLEQASRTMTCMQWSRPAPVITVIREDEPDAHLYAELDRVLAMARAHAAEGKGKERHAVPGQPFEEQVIVADSLALGSNHGNLLQVIKKTKESVRLPKERAIAELLGAINNLAAAVVVLELLDAKERDR